MRRSNNGGYILIYIVLLSAFLVLFFASIRHGSDRSLRDANVSNISITENSSLSDHLDRLRKDPNPSDRIDASRRLVSLERSSNSLSGTTILWTPSEYRINSSGNTSAISLSLITWIMSYRLAAWNSGSEASATVVGSGVVSTAGSITVPRTAAYDRHILYIESLGGTAQYRITTDSEILPSESHYRLDRTIGGTKYTEWIYTVEHFVPKSFTGIDYAKLGMYLKE